MFLSDISANPAQFLCAEPRLRAYHFHLKVNKLKIMIILMD